MACVSSFQCVTAALLKPWRQTVTSKNVNFPDKLIKNRGASKPTKQRKYCPQNGHYHQARAEGMTHRMMNVSGLDCYDQAGLYSLLALGSLSVICVKTNKSQLLQPHSSLLPPISRLCDKGGSRRVTATWAFHCKPQETDGRCSLWSSCRTWSPGGGDTVSSASSHIQEVSLWHCFQNAGFYLYFMTIFLPLLLE